MKDKQVVSIHRRLRRFVLHDGLQPRDHVFVEGESGLFDGLANGLLRWCVWGWVMNSIDHERVARHPELGKPFRKKENLPDGRGRWGGNEHIRHVSRAKGTLYLPGSLGEATEEIVEFRKKFSYLLKESRAGELADTAKSHGRRTREQIERKAPRRFKGAYEPSGRGTVEGIDEPIGSIEKGESVGGGWSIEDDEIEVGIVFYRVQFFHGHVLLRAGKCRGHVVVHLVVHDAVAYFRAGCVAFDDLIERPFGVEHHDGQRAGGFDTGLPETLGRDLLRVGTKLLQTEALGEPACRVDRQA